MISKRYNKLFNNFEGLKKADAKYQASLNNINKVKKELIDIKNIGKLTSKKSNIFFDDIKLNHNQIDIELNHLRDAILTDQIFDSSEVEILNDKFEDIFNISHSLNTIKNILDKKNVITDILYLELNQSISSFSKLFKTELNNILNEKKSIKVINRDLINFKNILGKYTEFDQKTFDEIKNKIGIDISILLLNKKNVVNIMSTKQIDNVEDYVKQIFTEISNFNRSFNELLKKYEKYINSSVSQINQKINESLENKTLKNENILEDIETILNTNKTAYEQNQDKKEAEEEKRLIAEENAKRAAAQAKLKAQERKKRQEKFYTFLGYFILAVGALLCVWGFWELCVYIWMNYGDIVVGIVTGILAIFSGAVFFAGSKILGAIFLIGTVFIYNFLGDLVPKTVLEENKKTELVQEIEEIKEYSKKSEKLNQIKAKKTIKSNQTNKCPSSGYKDNCVGRITYTSGNVYEGSFKNNKRHGQGTLYFNKGKWKGDKYKGQWKDNKYNGQGSYYWKDGRKYVGQWKNDDKHGQGTFTWPSGNKYMGQWKNDKQHGQGTMTYKSGKIEKGIWENGKFMYAQGSQNP